MTEPVSAGDRTAQERQILERHVDHLLGQLYHQLELIRSHQAEIAVLRAELEKLAECPVELDKALRRIEELRAVLTGRKEVELDLRRRLDELEAEDRAKGLHIEQLTAELNRVRQSPVRRALRAIRRMFGGGRHT